MATSGSTNFNLTRDQIIRQSFELLGIYSPSDTMQDEDLGSGAMALNMMIKSWQSDGVYIWKEAEATIFLIDGTNKYTLGPSGDHGSDESVRTALASSAATSATSLTVTSTTGMTAADYIGIQLDDDSLYWTTIVSVDSSTTLTITTGVTGAAASGNSVYSYTTRVGKPLFVTSARLRDKNNLDRRVEIYSREDYLALPNKTQSGLTYIMYYQPKVTTGELFLFLTPDDVSYTLQINYFQTLEDFDNSGDTPDFPQEWLETIVYNLAARLAPRMGKDQKLSTSIGPTADQLYNNLREWSHDHTYLITCPDFSNYNR